MELSWKLILYQAANFIVLMIVLGFIFNKFIRPFMHKRADDIKKSFEEIENQKKSVEGLRQSLTDQLMEIRQKSKEEIDKAIEDGNRIRDEILTQTEKESVHLLEKAKKEIEGEKVKAIIEVRKEVASLSIQATEQLLKKEVDNDTNRRLVEDFLKDVAGSQPKKGR